MAPFFTKSNRSKLIGVGGIVRGADAVQQIKAGADLVQIYSGFVYRSPDLIGEILRSLAEQRAAQPSLAQPSLVEQF